MYIHRKGSNAKIGFTAYAIAAKFSSKYFAFSGSFIHFFKNALDTDTVKKG